MSRPARPAALSHRAAPPPGRVRIIAGRYRRTPVPVVEAPGLRPTPDRVRETLFNWLEHLLGGWSGRRVLDAYAGSGALGFECASRGAAQVTLVERHPRALQALHALRERLGCAAVQILAEDALAALARQAPGSLDLVFLDPPFDQDVLARAVPAALRALAPQGLLYVERGAPLEAAQLAAWGAQPLRQGQAGAVHFHLLAPVS
jgi:16S rRNA (guanine(966)-N(2))-methyltransferase RsmD